MTSKEREEIFKAINNVSKKVNELSQKIDSYFNNRCDDNKTEIETSQDAICEESTYIEERLTDVENALCELSESEVE